jgi:hypothetical protein
MGLVSRWSQRPAVDYLVGLAALSSYRVARLFGLSPLVVQPGSQRTEIYQGSIAAASAVLAFVVVPVAIVLALAPGRRVTALLRRYPHDLRRATVAGGAGALLTLATGIGALAFDAGSGSNEFFRHAMALAVAVLFLSAARVIDLFAALLKTIASDTQSQGFDPSVGPVRPVKVPPVPDGVEIRVE